MGYTFYSFVRLPELSLDDAEEIRLRRPWLQFVQEKVSGSPTDRWYITKSQHDFPDFGEWNRFYTEPNGSGKIEILEIGIGIFPTSFTDPTTKSKLVGNRNGSAVLEPGGLTRYWIRSGMGLVGKDEVAIFLTSGINSWFDISFESWKAFWHVAHKYDNLLRAKRKLDQLRGTRKNSGAFERLSAEIHELISESLMEI